MGTLVALTTASLFVIYTARFNRMIDARITIRQPAKTAVYSANGQFLSNLYGLDRERSRPVSFAELPEKLVQAVLAAEDERFFSHFGVDPWSILRASIVNLTEWAPAQGGSTLTQQFIKNYFLTAQKTLGRKLEELFFSLLLERRLTKAEIFELYANTVYLGQYASFALAGFGEASRLLFEKPVSELTLSEAALLAGMIQAPNRYSPQRNPQEALSRRNHVLDLMEKKGFIGTRENALARTGSLAISDRVVESFSQAAFFVDHVRALVLEAGHSWQKNARFEVHTTLNVPLQEAAVSSVEKGLEEIAGRLGRRPRPEAALLAVRPSSGEILALVGGRDYGRSQFNRAIHAYRQPGSTFKPFVYAAALQAGVAQGVPITLATQLLDAPHTFRFQGADYSPRNSGDRYHGTVTLRRALSLSLNVPAVKLAQTIGYQTVADFSNQLGFSSAVKAYPSTPLGTIEISLLELVQAYVPFCNDGQLVPLKAIRSILSDGTNQQIPLDQPRQVLDPAVAFLITSSLQSAVEEGTAREVRARGFLLPAAGKTGTTSDSWFVGYTPELLAAVWVGYDNGDSLQLSGSQAALPIWTNFMKKARALGLLSGKAFAPPETLVIRTVDPRTGLLASPGCGPVTTEYFVQGSEPARFCGESESHLDVARLPTPPKNPKRRSGLWRWLKGIF